MFRSARILVDYFADGPEDVFRRNILRFLFLVGDVIIISGWSIASWPLVAPSTASIYGMMFSDPLKFFCLLMFLGSLLHWFLSVILEVARWNDRLCGRILLSHMDHCFYDINSIIIILFGLMAPAILLQDEQGFERSIEQAGRLTYFNISVYQIVMLCSLVTNSISALHELHPFLYPAYVVLVWVGGSAGFGFSPLSSARTFMQCCNGVDIASTMVVDIGQCLLKGRHHKKLELLCGSLFVCGILIMLIALGIYLTDPRITEQRNRFTKSKYRNDPIRICIVKIKIIYHFFIGVPYRMLVMYVYPFISLVVIIILIPAFCFEDKEEDSKQFELVRERNKTLKNNHKNEDNTLKNKEEGKQSFNQRRSEFQNSQLRNTGIDMQYEYGAEDDEHGVARQPSRQRFSTNSSNNQSSHASTHSTTNSGGNLRRNHHQNEEEKEIEEMYSGQFKQNKSKDEEDEEDDDEFVSFQDWVFLHESGLWYHAFYRCITCNPEYDNSDSDESDEEEEEDKRRSTQNSHHSHHHHEESIHRSHHQKHHHLASDPRLTRNSRNSFAPDDTHLRVGVGAPRGLKSNAPGGHKIKRTSLELQYEADEKAYREDLAKQMAARKSQEELAQIMGEIPFKATIVKKADSTVLSAELISVHENASSHHRHRGSKGHPQRHSAMAIARKSSLQQHHPLKQQSYQQHSYRERGPSLAQQHSIEEVDKEDDDSTVASALDYEAAAVQSHRSGTPGYVSGSSSPRGVVDNSEVAEGGGGGTNTVLSIIHNENTRIPEKLRQLKSLNLSEKDFFEAKKFILEKARSEKEKDGDNNDVLPSPSQRKSSFERQRSRSVEFQQGSVPQRKDSYGRHRSNSVELPTLNEQPHHQSSQSRQPQQHRPSQTKLQQQHRPSQTRQPQQHRPAGSGQQQPPATQWLQSDKQRGSMPERRESNFTKLTQSQRSYDFSRQRSTSVDEYYCQTNKSEDATRDQPVRLSAMEPVQVSLITPLHKQESSSSFNRPPPSLSQALHGEAGAPRPKNWQDPSQRNRSQQRQHQINKEMDAESPYHRGSDPPALPNNKSQSPEEEADYQKRLSAWL